MAIDDQKIIEKFSKGDKYVSIANKLLHHSIEQFSASYELQLQGERVFEILSQIMIDICSHLVGNISEIEPPTSYSECIMRLAEIGEIPPEQVSTNVEIVKMRNFIVHQYSDVDYVILYQSLQSLVKDFEKFKQYVLEWLET